MYKSLFAGICLFTLTACGSGTDLDDPDVDPDPDAVPNAIPEVLRENLREATYNAGAGTLTLDLSSLDAGPITAAYNRNAGLDIGPYQAYTRQDDPLDRHFTALVAQSIDPDRSVRAGAVADGGQFNTYFPGGFYERDGNFTPPNAAAGLVSYAGTYAAVTNMNAPGADLLAIPGPAVDASRRPRQSARVEGHIFLNAEFGDNTVNGNIINRTLVDYAIALPNIVLIPTDIDANGEFLGTTEYPDRTVNGDYGGIFGGTDASAVGGVVSLNSIDGPGDPLGFVDEEERGVFVLIQCGLPGEDPICANVRP
ncbi:thymidylate synthase [Profundibacter sp.]